MKLRSASVGKHMREKWNRRNTRTGTEGLVDFSGAAAITRYKHILTNSYYCQS